VEPPRQRSTRTCETALDELKRERKAREIKGEREGERESATEREREKERRAAAVKQSLARWPRP